MRGVAVLVGVISLLLGCFVFPLNAQEKSPDSEEKKLTFRYVGMAKCKVCHKAEARGDQYGIWASSAHAEAYNTLAGDTSKEIASRQKDMKDPQQDEGCLKCHVTAFGVDAELIEVSFRVEDGVQCEACHGPGSEYKSLKIMKALAQGTQDPGAVGLIVPDEKLCMKCHNKESPTYREFKFAESYDRIAHPVHKKEAK